jgi:hypothetical protein
MAARRSGELDALSSLASCGVAPGGLLAANDSEALTGAGLGDFEAALLAAQAELLREGQEERKAAAKSARKRMELADRCRAGRQRHAGPRGRGRSCGRRAPRGGAQTRAIERRAPHAPLTPPARVLSKGGQELLARVHEKLKDHGIELPTVQVGPPGARPPRLAQRLDLLHGRAACKHPRIMPRPAPTATKPSPFCPQVEFRDVGVTTGALFGSAGIPTVGSLPLSWLKVCRALEVPALAASACAVPGSCMRRHMRWHR